MSTPLDRLAAVLATQPARQDSVRFRARWLLELADAVDALNIDGTVDLAATARTAALNLINHAVECAA